MSELKIDTRIIEKLWNGELYEAEVCRLSGESYQKKLKSLNETHKQLLEILETIQDGEQIFEQYEGKRSELLEAEKQEAFKKGFCAAVSMMLECVQYSKEK